MAVATDVKLIFPINRSVEEDRQMTLSVSTSYLNTLGAFAQTYVEGNNNMPKWIEEKIYPWDSTKRFKNPEDLEQHLRVLLSLWSTYVPEIDNDNQI